MPAVPPNVPVAPIRQALARLLRAARAFACLGRRQTPPIAAPTPAPTEPKRHPGHTLARTTEWLVALARTLAGDRFFHHPAAYPRFAGRYPSLTAALRADIGLPPLPPPTEASRAAKRLHYMRKTFATQATGVIAARLARRLGLTKHDAAWPHALIAIATPPAQFAPARIPGRRPRPPRVSPIRPIPAFNPHAVRTPRRIPKRE